MLITIVPQYLDDQRNKGVGTLQYTLPALRVKFHAVGSDPPCADPSEVCGRASGSSSSWLITGQKVSKGNFVDTLNMPVLTFGQQSPACPKLPGWSSVVPAELLVQPAGLVPPPSLLPCLPFAVTFIGDYLCLLASPYLEAGLVVYYLLGLFNHLNCGCVPSDSVRCIIFLNMTCCLPASALLRLGRHGR